MVLVQGVNRNFTVEGHKYIDNIFLGHVHSGYDTVSFLWGIGKETLLKILKSREKTQQAGNTEEQWGDVMSQCKTFIASCYEYSSESGMTYLRYMIWKNKIANHKPTLKLPFADGHSMLLLIHLISNMHYRWSMNADTNKQEPVALPDDVSHAPESVLGMVKCGCLSSQPRSTACCNCFSASIA